MDNIRVLIVEDHEMTRLGLALVCENTEGIELIGQAENGAKGVKDALELHPDVVLMDIGLPQIDGIKALSLIKEQAPDIKVLMFTSSSSEDDIFNSLSAGADGYIMKGADKNLLIAALQAVSEGAAWLDPAIARLVLSSVKKQPSYNAANETDYTRAKKIKNNYGLTERELEVLSLIVEGLNNQQIAQKLCVEISTAKAHVHSILQKLDVKNRTQASRQAVKEGFV